jgi:serine/threonine protein phosphatase PrpC
MLFDATDLVLGGADPDFLKEKNKATVVVDGPCDFIIVACDGVWDLLSDQTAVDLVRESLFVRRETPAEAAVRLRTLAYVAGSTDNISVVVVLTAYGKAKVDSLPPKEHRKEHQDHVNPSHHEMYSSETGEYISDGEVCCRSLFIH